MHSLNLNVDSLFSFVLDLGIRVTVVMLVTMILISVLQSSSAAVRRLVWVAGLAVAVVLPGLMLIGPRIPVRIPVRISNESADLGLTPAASDTPSQEEGRQFRPDPSLAGANTRPKQSTPAITSSHVTGSAGTERTTNTTGLSFSVPGVIVSCVALGIIVHFLRLLGSMLMVRRLVRNACDIELKEWSRDWQSSSSRMGITSLPRLRETHANVPPLTCGLASTVVLFPDVARGWNSDQRRAVMMHELAHVRQRDVAVILLGRIACSLYFFHPLVWIAARQLLHECERTCDNLVLNAGHRATDYASHLIAIARSLANVQRKPSLSVAMSRTPSIEKRVSAILDDCQSRSNTRTTFAVTTLCLATLFSIAVAAPRYAQEQDKTNSDIISSPTGDSSNSTHRTDRNNVYASTEIPAEWDVATGTNVLWSKRLGTRTYGSPVVADGKVFIGTNNGAGHVNRLSSAKDMGCMLAFDSETGRFLWQYSAEKLETKFNDWPLRGITSTPYVDDGRLWFVNNRSEVVCLDVAGFHDDEDDGPTKDKVKARNEADVIWSLDLIKTFKSFPHNHSDCSITSDGRYLFIILSNGVAEDHVTLPAPQAPSFIALDRDSGAVVWSTGTSQAILHAQWSSPALAKVNGVNQVICPSGSGWLYGLDARTGQVIWQFDCNRKDSQWGLGGKGDRNNLIGMPLVHGGLVYIATGQDPNHQEGPADLWCIDPRRQGDVSMELMKGDRAEANPNSAMVWHFNAIGEVSGKHPFANVFHRSISTPSAKGGFLIATDSAGLVHCFDAKTGRRYWAHDLFGACWSSPVIVGDRIYVPNENGEMTVLKLSKELNVLSTVSMSEAMYGTPVISNNVLYVVSNSRIFAIQNRSVAANLTPPAKKERDVADLENQLNRLRRSVANMEKARKESNKSLILLRVRRDLLIQQLEELKLQNSDGDSKPDK